jgi:uncharacterized glyoxalase superfamily protein PhnB
VFARAIALFGDPADAREGLGTLTRSLSGERCWCGSTLSWEGIVEQGRFRVGLRVADVASAARFYGGLGFTELGTVPDDHGRPLMTILEREGVLLLADALEGMPFAESDRERATRDGWRGLGVAIGLGVDDLADVYRYCTAAGCVITSEPRDEAWGDRVFEFIDPFGYQWEISQRVAEIATDEALLAVQAEWSDRPS